jgi:hypothetical protein
MNKKIEEIMRNHGLHKNISQDCQHRIEMLSELIVRECASVANQCIDDEWFDVGGAILDHFGVKK